jgi:cysteine desulfurase/selenocysteine lyase
VSLDIQKIRAEFPLLERKVYKKPIVYFDNAATTQKPSSVIENISDYYKFKNSNIHRGVHFLSQEATEAFENARIYVQKFINASKRTEIIFTRGTTESINLVASSFAKSHLKPGDEVLITYMEHHSNIVPWQMACEASGASLKVCPITQDGDLDLDAFKTLLSEKTKLVAVTHVSNTLGTINPVKNIIEMVHQAGAYVLIDGAQAVAHLPVDVDDLDCDFYCFSGHKIYGPMGIGVLYGKEALLDALPPYQGGGEMIAEVTFEKTTYNELPFKFEAGTPDVAGVLGLEAALKFVAKTGLARMAAHENTLLQYATAELGKVGGISFFGQSAHKAAVLSFNLDGIHPYDAGTIIDKFAVAVRTGHLCTQPLIQFYNVPGFIRASFAVYNTMEEIDVFITAVKKAKEMLT